MGLFGFKKRITFDLLKVLRMEDIEFSELLQTYPPGKYNNVKNAIYRTRPDYGRPSFIAITTPDLYMHCDNEKCKGVRLFEHDVEPNNYVDVPIKTSHTINNVGNIEYLCQNCKESIKVYSLLVQVVDPDEGLANIVKIGEYPFFGPPVPARLITLVGPDRELFLKGRRCENQGLGVGAFTYYRRVIENQKNRLLDNIITVLEKLGEKKETIERLESAKQEVQFTSAIHSIKEFIPKQIYLNDVNPFQLLHKALSIGVHNLTDEDCLDHAKDIRVVLTEFSEKLASILKDHAELKDAITRLNRL